jgi:hypothetical protein
LYRFLFTRGPLWRIWNLNTPVDKAAIPETENSALPESFAPAAGDNRM